MSRKQKKALRRLSVGLLFSAVLGPVFGSPSHAQDASDLKFTFSDEKGLNTRERYEVLELVESFIRTNPQLVYEVIQRGRHEESQAAPPAAKQASNRASDLLTPEEYRALMFGKYDPHQGPVDATAPVLVEFFDYACAFCRAIKPAVTAYMERHPEVRHVYKELPILSPDSQKAAEVALALYRVDPDAYFIFHRALMKSRGSINSRMVDAALAEVGYSRDDITDAIDAIKGDGTISKNRAIAAKLNIGSTPAFVIDGRVITGPNTLDTVRKLLSPANDQ